MRAIYKKPTTKIILDGEKLKVLNLKSEIRRWLSTFLFNIILEVLYRD